MLVCYVGCCPCFPSMGCHVASLCRVQIQVEYRASGKECQKHRRLGSYALCIKGTCSRTKAAVILLWQSRLHKVVCNTAELVCYLLVDGLTLIVALTWMLDKATRLAACCCTFPAFSVCQLLVHHI